MVRYDPNKDRSEEYGWKKVCDENVVTEEEQDRWGKILIIFAAGLGVIAVIGS